MPEEVKPSLEIVEDSMDHTVFRFPEGKCCRLCGGTTFITRAADIPDEYLMTDDPFDRTLEPLQPIGGACTECSNVFTNVWKFGADYPLGALSGSSI